MAEKQADLVPETIDADDLAAQLERSRALQEEARAKSARADQTVSEMTSVLRRIAEAMDRNPTNWDDLFRSSRRERA